MLKIPRNWNPTGLRLNKLFYYDIANVTHLTPMSALLKLIPSTQAACGSDYPYVAMDANVIVFSQLGIDLQVLQ